MALLAAGGDAREHGDGSGLGAARLAVAGAELREGGRELREALSVVGSSIRWSGWKGGLDQIWLTGLEVRGGGRGLARCRFRGGDQGWRRLGNEWMDGTGS